LTKTALILTVLISFFMFQAALSASAEQPSSPKTVTLPAPSLKGSFPLNRAMSERRSLRQFKSSAITMEELSMLLWACQGQSDDKGHRTAPSAMASYPLELYVMAGNVSGLSPGVYRYFSKGHQLGRIAEGDRRAAFVDSAVSRQQWIKGAPVIFLITCVHERVTAKTGETGKPFVYAEVGLAAQNLFLEAVSLSMGGTYVGGFVPEKVKSFFSLPSDEEPAAVIPVGKKP